MNHYVVATHSTYAVLSLWLTGARAMDRMDARNDRLCSRAARGGLIVHPRRL